MFNYFRGNFIYDVLSVLPFFISRYSLPSYVEVVLLIRLTRVKQMFDNIEENLGLRERFSYLIDLLKLVYFIVFVGHLCACAWFYFTTFETENNNWLVR
jgi:potassium voltage-gated channel Eag-related subfamily H protein 5